MSSRKSLIEYKVSNDLVIRCRLAHSCYVKTIENFKQANISNEKNKKKKKKKKT